ncbi:MAG: HAD hydrolase family protein, partial [Clostridia bacterium]|nr:HAD hydrolase family protein [Clostridia bacterium]
ERGIYANFYIEKAYLFPFHGKFNDSYGEVTGVIGTLEEDIPSYIEKTGFVTPKILIYDEKEKLDIYQDEIVKLLPECEVVRSTDNMIDINLKGIDKGEACEKVANIYGKTANSVIAIGDAGNDYAMIKRAGLGVAVSNALPNIKEVASVIAPSNDEDAIKFIIDNYCI